MRQSPFIFIPVLLLILAGNAHAQSVRWEPGSGQLGFNQVSQLALVFEGCDLEGEPSIPQPDGLQIGSNPGQSSQTNIVNGRITSTTSYIFPVRPTSRSDITIPSFRIKTNKGELTVKEARFSVGDATVGRSGLTLDDISSVKLALPKTTLWAGEVVPVTYNLSILRRYLHQVDPRLDWQPAPLVAEEWSELRSGKSLVRGEERVVLEQNTRVYAKDPGVISVKPASKLASIVVGQSGGFFSGPETDNLNFATKPFELTVKPLPPAPAGFSGAVGDFNLTSKIIPTTPAIGEPVTWTLELTGTGNWPDVAGLPEREVSNDFQVVQPKSKRTMKDKALFEGALSEDVVLVPTKAGTYTIAPVKFIYFNTTTGSYQTITSETVTLKVSAAAATPTPAGTNAPLQFSLNLPAPQSSSASALPTPTAPVPPEILPREPIAGPSSSPLPYPRRTLWLIASLPALAAVLTAWLVLAAWRSFERDPEKRRRAARAKLIQLLTEMSSSDSQVSGLRSQVLAAPKPGEGGSVLSKQLCHWQHHTASLWEVAHAAPAAGQIAAAVAQRHGDQADAWAALWSDTDHTLHGPATELPPEWITRATTALQAVKIPGWSPLAAFAGRHLFPFFSVLFVLLVLAVSPSLTAANPAELYRSGEFPAAEKAWRAALAAAPTDWSARHNLGLALAQQDRWPEATAYWAGAFLQQPASTDTRAALTLGLQRSGLAPAELVSFSQGRGKHRLATRLSPGQWQLVLVGASLLIATAVILLLLNSYSRAGQWTKPAALTSVLVAILLAGLATFSLRTYGQLAHPEVVMVWQSATLRSIPTEADTAQKSTPLSAGSIAVVEQTFLGNWSYLTFATGQTGWVRSKALIKLYR